MSLMNYQEHFDNSYETVFNKTLAAKSVASTRFEAKLSYGESVERFKYDASGVRVRNVVRGAASVIDTISDSTELLEINIERESVFHISDGEVKQAGPLNPGTVIGMQVGHKIAEDLDHKVFSEVPNAANTFDAGDLTTISSTGVPISLDSTTVPQMSTRMPAKLKFRENQETTMNMVLAVDSYAAADVAQFLIAKDIDLAGATFANGYVGKVGQSGLVVSENLLGEYRFDFSGAAANDETLQIAGVTWTFKTAPAAAGEIDVAGGADAQAALLVDAINNANDNAEGAGTATTYFELTEADRNIVEDGRIRAEVDATNASLVKIYGAGRQIVASTITNSTGALNFIHSYYGKKGAIDLVVQDMQKVDMRPTDDRRGTNVFSHYLAGLKTFADGAVQFLDVWIQA